jgi:hypothetical protein
MSTVGRGRWFGGGNIREQRVGGWAMMAACRQTRGLAARRAGEGSDRSGCDGRIEKTDLRVVEW